MNIDVKISVKPIEYIKSVNMLEKRVMDVLQGKKAELLWILEHNPVYTAGTSSKMTDLLDKNLNLIKTNRGGKITFHGPGQLIFYFIIDLKKRNINIRKLISSIEKTIIDTLSYFKIKSFADRKNIGIWYRNNQDIEKVAAIGIKVKKWIAYHGFSININIDLKKYEKIIPCGIKEKKITNLIKIKKQNYKIIKDMLIKNLLTNIQN